MIRAFIALTPPLALQQVFRELAAALPTLPVRWVKPEYIHLTLRFLGDVSHERLAEMSHALQSALSEQAFFTVLARSLGCFPNLSRPRMVWMGLDDSQRCVAQLQHRVEAAVTSLGFAPEPRPFRPHLTLARLQPAPGYPQLRELLQTYQHHTFGEMPIAHVHLFQSQLQRSGAVYTILHSIVLRN